MKGGFKIPKSLIYKGNPNNWLKFKQQFDIYMKVTGLIDSSSENKVNIFLNIAGEEALDIFNELQLDSAGKKDFELVMKGFEDYCIAKQNVIYKSYQFFTRYQQPNETFNNFYADLQMMAEFCNFGDQKDRLIRDRIIVGMRNPELQDQLLKYPDISLKDVLTRCFEVEGGKNENLKCEPITDHIGIDRINEGIHIHEENVCSYDEYIYEPIHISSEIVDSPLNDILIDGDASDNSVETMAKDLVASSFQSPEDVKPADNLYRTSSRVETSTNQQPKFSNQEEKKNKKKEKAERIQMKIAEIKKNLSNIIQTEGETNMAIRKKLTRSSKRNIKNEPCEIFEDLNSDEGNSRNVYGYDKFLSFCEQRKSKRLISQIKEKVTLDGTVESNYLSENGESRLPVDQTQFGKRVKRKLKKNETKIIKIKRENFPPLVLKSVKKKTLLLSKIPYSCEICDSSFWTDVQLERHLLVHLPKKNTAAKSYTPKKVFTCEVCTKEFKKICDLERHTRVHTGEKPSVCNICNKGFQQAYNLSKHRLTHTQEKNFECIICQKRFGRSDVLNRHVLTHSVSKPFQCSICSKTFIRNSQLRCHLKKHNESNQSNNIGLDYIS